MSTNKKEIPQDTSGHICLMSIVDIYREAVVGGMAGGLLVSMVDLHLKDLILIPLSLLFHFFESASSPHALRFSLKMCCRLIGIFTLSIVCDWVYWCLPWDGLTPHPGCHLPCALTQGNS